MPIRGYIIEKYNTMTNAYTCNRLVQEASALDMDLQIVGIHDTAVSPHGVINHGKILEPVDFVIMFIRLMIPCGVISPIGIFISASGSSVCGS